MKLKYLFPVFALMVCVLVACGPTPQELADEHFRLHQMLQSATNETDSVKILKDIQALETKARAKLNKKEYKEYRKLVTDEDNEVTYTAEQLEQTRVSLENMLKAAKTAADSAHFKAEIQRVEQMAAKLKKDDTPNNP